MASEASYVYIIDKTLLKMPKIVNLKNSNETFFGDFPTLCMTSFKAASSRYSNCMQQLYFYLVIEGQMF